MAYKTCETCIHNRICKYADEKVSLGTTVREIMHRCVDYKNKADFVNVVRCKDCKHGRKTNRIMSPEKFFKEDCVVCECEDVVGDEPMIYVPTHFCSYGERRDEECPT